MKMLAYYPQTRKRTRTTSMTVSKEKPSCTIGALIIRIGFGGSLL